MKKRTIFLIITFIIFFILMVRWSYSAEITLGWTANTEPDLAGYKLHYTTIKAGGPYETTIDVGNVLEYTITDLDFEGNDYWFVATAYNVEGLDSGYSNEVNTVQPDAPQSPGNVLIKDVNNPLWRLFLINP